MYNTCFKLSVYRAVSPHIVYLSVAATPDNPSRMEVTDVGKGEVSLRWARPSDDGGDRIQGYIVEYKPIGGHWTKHNDTPIKDLDTTSE